MKWLTVSKWQKTNNKWWQFWKPTHTTEPVGKIALVDMHSLKPGDIIPHPTNTVIVPDSGMGNLKPGQKITVGKINGKRPKSVFLNGIRIK